MSKRNLETTRADTQDVRSLCELAQAGARSVASINRILQVATQNGIDTNGYHSGELSLGPVRDRLLGILDPDEGRQTVKQGMHTDSGGPYLMTVWNYHKSQYITSMREGTQERIHDDRHLVRANPTPFIIDDTDGRD